MIPCWRLLGSGLLCVQSRAQPSPPPPLWEGQSPCSSRTRSRPLEKHGTVRFLSAAFRNPAMLAVKVEMHEDQGQGRGDRGTGERETPWGAGKKLRVSNNLGKTREDTVPVEVTVQWEACCLLRAPCRAVPVRAGPRRGVGWGRGAHSRNLVMYSRLQRDQVRGTVSYRSCGDMMKGRFPTASQSLPLPSC